MCEVTITQATADLPMLVKNHRQEKSLLCISNKMDGL